MSMSVWLTFMYAIREVQIRLDFSYTATINHADAFNLFEAAKLMVNKYWWSFMLIC